MQIGTKLAQLAAQTGIADTPVLWWSGDLIEAYLRCEMPDQARHVLRRLEASAAKSSIPGPASRAIGIATAILRWWCRAVIARPDSMAAGPSNPALWSSIVRTMPISTISDPRAPS